MKSMSPEEFFAREFSRYRSEFGAGNPIALSEAVLLALWNNLAVPEWAVPEVEGIIKMHAEGRFERKQGVAAPWAVEARHRKAAAFYHKVEWLLRLDDPAWRWYAGEQQKTKTVAFEVAAGIFRDAGKRTGNREHAHANFDTVRNAYYAVQRAIRNGKGAIYGVV